MLRLFCVVFSFLICSLQGCPLCTAMRWGDWNSVHAAEVGVSSHKPQPAMLWDAPQLWEQQWVR
jgi:hypothetical protein